MTSSKSKFELTSPDHPVAKLANALSNGAHRMAAELGMSKMELCLAYANACGQILADAGIPQSGGKPLRRDEAIDRMDDLRKCMEGAYDLRTVEGTS